MNEEKVYSFEDEIDIGVKALYGYAKHNKSFTLADVLFFANKLKREKS